MHDPGADAKLVVALAARWRSTRVWAEQLLVDGLGLARAEDVLLGPHRGLRQLPGTAWWYRTHGVGVDVFQPGNKGGIVFDFDKPKPCGWRLRLFLVKQFNAGNLRKADYRPLVQDQARWHAAVDASSIAMHDDD